MSITSYFTGNKHVMKWKSGNPAYYNHNSMAVGKFYIEPANIGIALMGLINNNIADMPLVPHASKNIKFFADIDNHKQGIFIFCMYCVFCFCVSLFFFLR